MSKTEFFPGSEEGTNEKGELASDIDNVQSIVITEDVKFNSELINRKEVLDFGDQAFLLDNLLTEQECQSIIAEGERIGFQRIKGAQDNYRSAQRITVESDILAELLYRRILPYLLQQKFQFDQNYKEQHVHSTPLFLLDGEWELQGLNNLFRLCRYEAGGHFAPHFDGYYQRNSNERSMKTLMLYLNGDFEGGSTNFVDEGQTLYKDENGKYCAEEKNILCRVEPQCGMGIIFNHHRLHEGGKLKSNVKYILRTDVMYQKIKGTKLDERHERALSLMQEAERLEGMGQCLEAADHYRRAFKLCPELENVT